MDVDSSSSFFEALLLPYLVALKAINPFHQESYENTRAKAKNLGQTVKTQILQILASFSQK